VNFPERRRSRRYLTLKNAAFAAATLVVAFILLSFWSALRPAHSGTSLFEPRVASSESPAVPREPFAVVHEGSTDDYPRAASILNDAPVAPSPPPARKKNIERPAPQLGQGQRVTISGGRGRSPARRDGAGTTVAVNGIAPQPESSRAYCAVTFTTNARMVAARRGNFLGSSVRLN
jgi:hypothetical protein